MKKILSLGILMILMLSVVAYATPIPQVGNVTRKNLWANDLNDYLLTSLTDGGNLKDSALLNGSDLVYEGSTVDDNKLILKATDPNSNYTLTLPAITGTLITTNDVGTVTSSMISDGTISSNDLANLASITLVDDTSDIKTATTAGDLHIQRNADSNGRVRLFRDTTGNPLFNIWGYDAGNSVQKPLTLGVFNDPAFTEAGGTARAIITSGGNGATDRNALEIQSPSQVRITAVDDILNLGNVRIASDTYTTIHSRTAAETDAAKYIKFDTVGGVAGANPTIETNAGDLVLMPSGKVSLTGNIDVSGTATANSFSGAGTGLTGTATGLNIGGNAATVTNGIYSTSSYADPSWVTSLAGSKISGAVASATSADHATSADSATGATTATTANALANADATGQSAITAINTATTGTIGFARITEADPIFIGSLDVNTALTADSDSKVATQKATKAYVDAEASARTTADTTLQNNINAKVASNTDITGATKTKITYDTKGLVTAGVDATTADIAASTNRNYVTDAQLTVIGSTSGANTGDETQATIKTKIGAATTGADGYLTSADWNTFNGKQDALGFVAVPNTRTVNGHVLLDNVVVTASDVGLGSVQNTADLAKPISTATQTALDLKASLTSPTLVTPNIGVATATSVDTLNVKQTTDNDGGKKTLYIQKDADSSGRVRLFRDTLGNPMLNIWGYDSTDHTQKYLTLYVADAPAFTEAGGTARAIITAGDVDPGGRTALELQSPTQVRITAVDTTYSLGNVRIAADQYIRFHPRTEPEADSAKYLTLDTVGQVQGADVELSTNSGDLVLNPAGNVKIKNGFTGTCASTTTLTVVNGIITDCR